MLTDLQKRKIKNLFAVHDLDRDGVLRQRDFEEYTRRITTPRGWKPGSPEYDEVRSRFMTFWAGLTAKADTSHDHRVTIDEWFAYLGSTARRAVALRRHSKADRRLRVSSAR